MAWGWLADSLAPIPTHRMKRRPALWPDLGKEDIVDPELCSEFFLVMLVRNADTDVLPIVARKGKVPGLRIWSIFGRIRIQQIRILKTGSGSYWHFSRINSDI